MHQSWKLARMKVLREFESHLFRHYTHRKPSTFNELLGFLLAIFSTVPALVPIYSSNRSLVRGRFSSLSLGGGVAVLLWRYWSSDAASKSLTRCSSCSLASTSLDAGMTKPPLIRRSSWNCLKVWVLTLPKALRHACQQYQTKLY